MPKTDLKDLPAALGGTPVFDSTSTSDYPKLEQWRQISEAEAQVAYEMTLRNELSGASPVVQAFEQMWRERHHTEYAISLINGKLRRYTAPCSVSGLDRAMKSSARRIRGYVRLRRR